MAKSNLEKTISKLYKAVESGEIDIEELSKYKGEFGEYSQGIQASKKMVTKMARYLNSVLQAYFSRLDNVEFWDDELKSVVDTNGKIRVSDKVLERFLKLCNDYYVYSKSGDVLIPDSEYDDAMEMYIHIFGHERISTSDYDTDNGTSTKWDIIKHTNPNMVGTLDKVYTIEALYDFISQGWRSGSVQEYAIFAPKFDGTSVALTVVDGEITMALTRKDGYAGQNIIEIIKRCSNYDQLKTLAKTIETSRGSIKCEILCSTENYEKLKKVASYANRRSAVSGIINTPSNLKYAKFLTVEPLLVNHDNKRFDYVPSDGVTVFPVDIGYDVKKGIFKDDSLEKKIHELLDKFKSSSYPYRADGVVIYLPSKDVSLYRNDAMQTAIAFKVNTQFGITEVLSGYMSIGRTGVATPMIKVMPCDVNETIVEDVSLSNLTKAEKFNLHEGDRVCIESSGDVIPMIKEVVSRSKDGKKIRFGDICPFCGSRLRPISEKIIGCTNPTCERIITGKIVNFFDKMGMNGVSDETIMQLVKSGTIKGIKSALDLTVNDLKRLDGWGDTSAENFINGLHDITSKPKSEAEFIGALGIPNVSIKKAEIVCKVMSLDKICKLSEEGKKTVIRQKLLDSDGFGIKTVDSIVDFFDENCYGIDELKSRFNLVSYQPSIGDVVFTNFRDSEMEEAFKKHGFSIGSSVTKNTKFVIAPPGSDSTKIKKAKEKGIKILTIQEAEKFLDKLEDNVD